MAKSRKQNFNTIKANAKLKNLYYFGKFDFFLLLYVHHHFDGQIRLENFPPGKTKRRFWAKFRLFSAHFPLIFCLWYPICCFSSHMNSPISTYFPPIFCLKWYPILVINSSIVPICCFSAHMFMDFAYFPPIFHSFSAYFPPNLPPIFRRSCLAGLQDSSGRLLWCIGMNRQGRARSNILYFIYMIKNYVEVINGDRCLCNFLRIYLYEFCFMFKKYKFHFTLKNKIDKFYFSLKQAYRGWQMYLCTF